MAADPNDLKFTLEPRGSAAGPETGANEPEAASPRAGEHCPYCGEGVLEYDSMLNLVCPACWRVVAGNYT